jgi:two-component system response regulator RpfG
VLAKYRRAVEWRWVQEESQNMGAWFFVEPRLRAMGFPVEYVGRDASASPATGSHHIHEMEQRELALLTRLAKLASQREGADLRIFERISALSAVLADGLGLGGQYSRSIEHAAQLHDIGNIGVPDAILNQAGPLSPGQRLLMQQHAVLGHEALQGDSGLLQLSAEIALGHHERWDGSGYPHGLAGERIPLSARIVAVADVLDALLSPRPYRDAWPVREALEHMYGQAGLHFDPAVIKVLASREEAIIATHLAFEAV